MPEVDYRETVRNLSRPASDVEKQVEMLAMFLCDSGIISLGPSADGHRLSGGHGWNRALNNERDMYREQAKIILDSLTVRKIP